MINDKCGGDDGNKDKQDNIDKAKGKGTVIYFYESWIGIIDIKAKRKTT